MYPPRLSSVSLEIRSLINLELICVWFVVRILYDFFSVCITISPALIEGSMISMFCMTISNIYCFNMRTSVSELSNLFCQSTGLIFLLL